jgi:Tfp pilus assembly major pilin PilA
MESRVLYATLVVAILVVMVLPGVATAVPAVTGLHAGIEATPASYTSYNWAGYFATGVNGSVTKVTGSWVQPSVKCTSGTQYAVDWVGIDGATSKTVEQIGTLSQCSGTKATYYTWWELYPLNSIQKIGSITLKPGDTVNASVTYSSSKFVMKITVGTASFTKTATQSGTQRNSAECIVERPALSSGGNTTFAHLADFSKVSMYGCKATISGVTGGIGTFSSVGSITMVSQLSGNATLASTSALNSVKAGFTVTWKKAN